MNPDQQSMLDELVIIEDGLSDSEIRYIESLDRQRDRALSPNQAAWLRRISERF